MKDATTAPPSNASHAMGTQSPCGESVYWSDNQTPFNPRFNDIYRSVFNPTNEHGSLQGKETRDQGLLQARHVFLGACGLLGEQALWRDQAQWSILENGFGLGLNFLATYQAWLEDPRRPRHLHYCAIEAYPVSLEDFKKSASVFSELLPICEELQAQYWGLTPGFHRITLAKGHVHLTLCIGEVQDMLHQLNAHFDSLFLDGFDPQKNPQMWSELTMKGIAARAKWGAIAATWSVSAVVRKNLETAGFECEKRPGLPPKREALKATYNPTWRDQILNARPSTNHQLAQDPAKAHDPSLIRSLIPNEEVIILGAGLAGASLAHTLALRGIRVLVIDPQGSGTHRFRGNDSCAETHEHVSSKHPSSSEKKRSDFQHFESNPSMTKSLEQGAHGLPFGLFHPMSSRDDNLQSKMTRSGIRVLIDTLQRLDGLKAGEAFKLCGVLEKMKTGPSKRQGSHHSPALQTAEKKVSVEGQRDSSPFEIPQSSQIQSNDETHEGEHVADFEEDQLRTNLDSSLQTPSQSRLQSHLQNYWHNHWQTHWTTTPSNEQLEWLIQRVPQQKQDGDPSLTSNENVKTTQALFHPKAGWVNVQSFISALLDHPLITVLSQEEVIQMVYDPPKDRASNSKSSHEDENMNSPMVWQVHTQSLHHPMKVNQHNASHVVLCTSVATRKILQERLRIESPNAQLMTEDLQRTLDAWPLQAIKGQLTLGEMRDLSSEAQETKDWPSFAVNGQSSWMGDLKADSSLNEPLKTPLEGSIQSPLFCIGASYERDMKEVVNSKAIRQSNLQKLSSLMPSVHLNTPASLRDWSGTRSTCQDRLPLVGPLGSDLRGLWVMSALGSRGLSMSVMLSEHLVSMMTLEPSPLPKRLAQAIHPGRFLKKRPDSSAFDF